MIRLAALVATAGETKDLLQGAPPLRTTAVVETLRKNKTFVNKKRLEDFGEEVNGD
jgi:hypothetical protein